MLGGCPGTGEDSGGKGRSRQARGNPMLFGPSGCGVLFGCETDSGKDVGFRVAKGCGHAANAVLHPEEGAIGIEEDSERAEEVDRSEHGAGDSSGRVQGVKGSK